MDSGIHMRRRDASECEDGTQTTTSASVTPENPDALQHSSLQVDSGSNECDSKGKVKCFPLDARRGGQAYTCLMSCKAPKDSLARKIGAEFFGTFILVFTAVAGPIVNQKYNGVETLIGNALCGGLAVLMGVLTTGHISGAHLNPAVSIGLATLRQFPWAHVPGYILAQVLAALCASFALKGLFHPTIAVGVTAPSVGIVEAFALEFITTFHLLFVITAVAKDTRAEGSFAGVGIGAAVMVNILVAGPSTGASMNPARTLGPAIVFGSYKVIWLYGRTCSWVDCRNWCLPECHASRRRG